MKKFVIILLALFFLAALPKSALAANTFLPTLNNGTPELPDWLDPDSPDPGEIPPTPEPPVLTDGLYTYEDSITQVDFKVSGGGTTVDYGGFHHKVPDSLKPYCYDAGGGFLQSVSIKDGAFSMVNEKTFGIGYTGTMSCKATSSTQAYCTFHDYTVDKSDWGVNCPTGASRTLSLYGQASSD